MIGIGLSFWAPASGSIELIANGGFATNDITGWSDVSTGTYTVDASTGACRLVGTNSVNRAWIEQAIATVVGAQYRLQATRTASVSGQVNASVGPSSKNGSLVDVALTGTPLDTTFTASGATTYIGFRTSTGGGNVTFDNVSVVRI